MKKEEELNTFNMFGFEVPEFEGGLITIVNDSIIGYVINEDGETIGVGWNPKTGKSDFLSRYNLSQVFYL